MMRIFQKNLIIIAVSLIMTFAIFFLIISPTINYIKIIKDQIKIEREKMEKKYQRIIYQRQNSDKVKEIEQRLVVLDDLFLITDQELKFITTLESVAEKNNVSQKINLKSANLNDPQQTTFSFIISANGATYDIISYLLEIEQLSYYINFNALNINAKNSNKELDAVLNGEIYLLK